MKPENQSPYRSFGENLKKYMDEVGWTPSDLIRATGLKQSTISDLLNGKTDYPRADLIFAIFRATDANPDFLITGEGPVRRSQTTGAARNFVKALRTLQDDSKSIRASALHLKGRIDATKTNLERIKSLQRDDAGNKYLEISASLENMLNEMIKEYDSHLAQLGYLQLSLVTIKESFENGMGGSVDSVETPLKPEAIEEGYKLLFEAVKNSGGDLMAIDPKRFAGVLRIAVREISRPGYSEEVRRHLIREAELILDLVKN